MTEPESKTETRWFIQFQYPGDTEWRNAMMTNPSGGFTSFEEADEAANVYRRYAFGTSTFRILEVTNMTASREVVLFVGGYDDAT